MDGGIVSAGRGSRGAVRGPGSQLLPRPRLAVRCGLRCPRTAPRRLSGSPTSQASVNLYPLLVSAREYFQSVRPSLVCRAVAAGVRSAANFLFNFTAWV